MRRIDRMDLEDQVRCAGQQRICTQAGDHVIRRANVRECFKPGVSNRGQGGDVSATRPALRGWSGRPIDLVPTLASLVSRNLPPV